MIAKLSEETYQACLQLYAIGHQNYNINRGIPARRKGIWSSIILYLYSEMKMSE
jgi:hypothetical protein